MALPAALVAVRIGVTVSWPRLVWVRTYTILPVGEIATSLGTLTSMVFTRRKPAVLMTTTLPTLSPEIGVFATLTYKNLPSGVIAMSTGWPARRMVLTVRSLLVMPIAVTVSDPASAVST